MVEMKFSPLPLETRCEEATRNLVLRFQLEVSPWSELYITQEHLLVKNHLVRPEGNVLTLIFTGRQLGNWESNKAKNPFKT